MVCTNTDALVAFMALFISEVLPFVGKYFPGRLKGASGLIHMLFVLLFRSGCVNNEQAWVLEHVLQKDIDGDGIVGTPPTSPVSSPSPSSSPSVSPNDVLITTDEKKIPD